MTRQTKPPTLGIDLSAIDDTEDVEELDEPEPTPPEPVKQIPISKFNLSRVKGYKQKKALMKQQLLVSNTIAELKHALSIFDPEEIRLNHSLILFVCQIVEDIFTKTGLGEIKNTVVVEVCKEYFKGDAELVQMVIDIVFDKVIKTNWFRQNKTRIADIFFWVLRLFGDRLDVRYQTNFKTSLGPSL